MKHELELFRRETSAAMDHARHLVGELSAELLHQRPAPTEWSAGECLDHLTITARAYHPLIDEAIARGAPLSAREYQPSWIWRKFLASLEPPVKRKFKTAPAFIPQAQRPPGDVLREFLEEHQRLIDALPRIEPLDLSKIRIASPFAHWMRYPLGLVFYLVPAHCRRHLWQADQAVARFTVAGE